MRQEVESRNSNYCDMKFLFLIVTMVLAVGAYAQETTWGGKFEQLDNQLPTPNEYRTGSGAPGPRYWQQQADYTIVAELNDEKQSITGSETITYFNNSPDVLKYVWLQLDQNKYAKGNNTDKTFVNQIEQSNTTKKIAEDLNLHE